MTTIARDALVEGQSRIGGGPHRTVTYARKAGFVISLDFELHWGVRDHTPLDAAERKRLLAARSIVPRILDLFDEFSIHATWATVGFLFARSRKEAERFRPPADPGYVDQRLNPYRESIGASESEDPFHFAPSLISEIASRQGQEIASHSFSHYYCMESGQSAEDFEADLHASVEVARNSGYELRSYVFPRNQVNPEYLKILDRQNIKIYRANEEVAMKESDSFSKQRRPHKRAVRFLDAYMDVCGSQTAAWPAGGVPALIRPSRYLRTSNSLTCYFEPWLIGRIRHQMCAAVENGEIFHLWWHPEDFAGSGEQSLQVLRKILVYFSELRRSHGMQSLSMAETLDSNPINPVSKC
jgi:peptidoglycan/xylan/chitin deacetylase (PgdA/CDA1 family)